jgi:hypothetical protein
MIEFDNISLIHKIVFQTLDKHAKDSGYKDWKDMQEKNNIKKPQSFMIEELIRSALNKLDSEISSNTHQEKKK